MMVMAPSAMTRAQQLGLVILLVTFLIYVIIRLNA